MDNNNYHNVIVAGKFSSLVVYLNDLQFKILSYMYGDPVLKHYIFLPKFSSIQHYYNKDSSLRLSFKNPRLFLLQRGREGTD